MVQHFLLSAKARTLSLSAVLRISDEVAHATFIAIRWADNNDEAYCPKLRMREGLCLHRSEDLEVRRLR